jgi:hypothetical protein
VLAWSMECAFLPLALSERPEPLLAAGGDAVLAAAAGTDVAGALQPEADLVDRRRVHAEGVAQLHDVHP